MGRQPGFSVIELVVMVAILVAMAGVVLPIVNTKDGKSPEQRANEDVHRIAQAVQSFIRDTHQFPTGANGTPTFHFLHTAGAIPGNNVLDSGPTAHLYDFLVRNELRVEGWRGPYLDRDVGPDPWGRAYLVNVNGFFSSAERVAVLSSGPNGQLNTSPSATVAGGDDILVVLE